MVSAASGQRRRVLLVTSVLPWPLHRNGGAQRTDLLRRALAEERCDVDILALAPRPGPELPEEAQLRLHGVVATFPVNVSLALHPRPRYVPAGFNSLWSLSHVRRTWRRRYEPVPEVTQWIQQREGGYDAIYVRYLQTALLAGLDHRNPAQRPQVIVDVDDVDWLTLESRFGAQPWPGVVGRLGMALALRTVRTRCTRALPAFNGFFVTSEIDVQEMRRWGQEPLLLANIPHPETIASNAPRPTPPPAGSRSVLFVGDLEFGPNATGLEWFLRECWPLIRSGVGDAQLRIVGRGLSEHQRQEWSKAPGVTVVGFADDLRDEYARCACTIGPTWWGGGTKIKVVESAAMGRACVATPHAVRGFEYLARGPAPGIIVAGDAREFASAVVRLLDDPDRRGKMGNSAMILAAWHSNLETFRRPVAEMQERLEEELRTAR